jgi:hypothetical protein
MKGVIDPRGDCGKTLWSLRYRGRGEGIDTFPIKLGNLGGGLCDGLGMVYYLPHLK